MSDQKTIELGFQAEKHRQVSAGGDGVGDMGRADDADLYLAGKHRLGGAAGDDEDKLRIEIILAKKSLFLGDPEGNGVATNVAVDERESDLGFSTVYFGDVRK